MCSNEESTDAPERLDVSSPRLVSVVVHNDASYRQKKEFNVNNG
jgi:hypothetical protein